jgi:prepilin-type N-terminal cleavage/methylation domain-containing protein
MKPPAPGNQPACPRGFTIVELLAVVSIIALLSGLLLPTLGAAKSAALRAKTRVQFSQWTAALEQFRQEYGYYPAVATGGRLATAADTAKFVRTLSGRNLDGSPIASAADLNGNTKRIAFLAFAAGDLFDPDHPDGGIDYDGDELLQDAFGNTEIGLLIDRNGDGFVRPADDGPAASVAAVQTGLSFAPGETDLPAAGVQTGILIYSAGRGSSQADMILSWK